ncbi:MAG TPA: hypothetical protein VH853_11510 [Polyangia bacterium]|jgi:hypothetical protein|nr:hypothetical protein [Polyangia bacterium]
MISNSNVLRRPSRSVVLLSQLKRTTLRLGSLTQAFFRKGDELEASGFENLPPDDPTLVPPRLGFRNFDRVPRNRAPLLIAVLLVGAAAVSVFEWRAVRDVPNETARVAASARIKASSELVRVKALVGSRHAAP